MVVCSRGHGRRGWLKRPFQNWHGQGESDCLIKTKQGDGPQGC